MYLPMLIIYLVTVLPMPGGSQRLEFGRKLTHNRQCHCGVQLEKNQKPFYPWKLYVHYTASPAVTRTCVGTVISSNIIITSHKCGVQGEKEPWFHTYFAIDKSQIVDKKHLTVNNNVKKDEGTIHYKVLGLYPNYKHNKNQPSHDILAILVDHDLTSWESVHKPICFPHNGQKGKSTSKFNIVGQNVIYESKDGEASYNLQVKKAKECDKSASDDFICVTFPGTSLNIDHGLPLYASINENSYAPEATYTYLAGMTHGYTKEADGQTHLFFININSGIHIVEKVTNQLITYWCSHPWPWKMIPVTLDQSLDCSCGLVKDGLKGQSTSGNDAIPYEFPWMIKIRTSVLENWKLQPGLCGGSIINDRIILTSANCIVSRDLLRLGYDMVHPRNKYKIFLNSHKAINDSREIEVEAKWIIIHPGYVDGRKRNNAIEQDLALLVLDKPLDFLTLGSGGKRMFSPICFLDKSVWEMVGWEAIITGWGRTNQDNGDTRFSDVMQKRKVRIKSLEVCKEQLKSKTDMSYNNVLCGGISTDENIHEGDFGGPVMVPIFKNDVERYMQVGLSSFPELNLSYGLSVQPIYTTDGSKKTGEVAFYSVVNELLPFVEYYSSLYNAKYCKD